MTHSSTLLLLGLSFFAIGYLVRETSQPTAQPEQESIPSSPNSLKSKPHNKLAVTAVNDPGGSLAKVLQSHPSRHSWLTAADLIENSSVEDLQKMIGTRADSDPHIAQMIIQRWIELDADHLFNLAISKLKKSSQNIDWAKNLELMAKHWPAYSREAAIKAFDAIGDEGLDAETVERIRLSLIYTLMLTDFPQSLQLAKRWDAYLRVEDSDFRKLVRQKPGIITQQLLNHFHTNYHPPSAKLTTIFRNGDRPEGRPFLDVIVKSWAPDNFTQFIERTKLGTSDQSRFIHLAFFRKWAMSDPEKASLWVNQQAEEAIAIYYPSLLESWAQEDSSAALEWTETHLKDDQNYDGAVEAIITGVIATDPDKATTLLSSISDDSTRIRAARIVGFSLLKIEDDQKIPNTKALNWVRSLDLPLKSEVLKNAYRWAESDPTHLKEFFAEESQHGLDVKSHRSLIASLVRQNPLNTLQWAASHQEHSQSLTSMIYKSWLWRNSKTAVEYFHTLKKDDPRRILFLEKAKEHLNYSQHDEKLIKSILPDQTSD